MRKIALGMLALAAGVMTAGLTPASANPLPVAKGSVTAPSQGVTPVGHRHGGIGMGGPRFAGPRMGGPHIGMHRRHHIRPYLYFGPSYYRSYSYYDYNGCYWLKRKALYTGSRYWWRRYWECRNGY